MLKQLDDHYSHLRVEVKRLKQQCEDEYISDIEDKLAKNPKCFFSYTKSLKSSNSVPNVIQYQNVTAKDNQSICDVFAKYFQSVYQEPDSDTIPVQPSPSKFKIPQFPPSKIKPVLDKLDHYKVSSPDSIPAIFYKSTSASISLPLSLLYNKSIAEKKFPTVWKESFVTPIHKSGSKTKATNYRPISILCTISKIFERLMFNELYAHTRPKINRSQHGFIVGKSTLTNLIEYSNYVAESIA